MEQEFESDDFVARSKPRRLRRVFGSLAGIISTLLVWAFVAVAILSATGRFRMVAVSARGSDVHVATNAVAIVEPIPTLSLKEGDVFLAKPRKGGTLTYYKVTAVDSWTRDVTVHDQHGKLLQMKLGGQAWRLIGTAPIIGGVFHLATGPIQAAIFVILGLALIGRAEMLRHTRSRGSEVTPMTA
jgi:hypothetical protein